MSVRELVHTFMGNDVTVYICMHLAMGHLAVKAVLEILYTMA